MRLHGEFKTPTHAPLAGQPYLTDLRFM